LPVKPADEHPAQTPIFPLREEAIHAQKTARIHPEISDVDQQGDYREMRGEYHASGGSKTRILKANVSTHLLRRLLRNQRLGKRSTLNFQLSTFK
jgi:hypothetical protein